MEIESRTKLSGIRKSSKYSIYTFTKGEDFVTKIKNFLADLGFKDLSTDFLTVEQDGTEHDLNPTKIFDTILVSETEDYVAHFIFGKEKIFMIIHYNRDKIKEISDKIFKYFSLTSSS